VFYKDEQVIQGIHGMGKIVVRNYGAIHSSSDSMVCDYTMHPTNFSLHTTHYTLHTTHYTLHTTHYTLHTTTQRTNTQHTTHYTLHTTHYTLHTTHYTLHTLHTTHYITNISLLKANFRIDNTLTPPFPLRPGFFSRQQGRLHR